MAKLNQIEKAVAALDEQIKALTFARQLLIDQAAVKPWKQPRRIGTKAVPAAIEDRSA
jgi:hypothetical protein